MNVLFFQLSYILVCSMFPKNFGEDKVSPILFHRFRNFGPIKIVSIKSEIPVFLVIVFQFIHSNAIRN